MPTDPSSGSLGSDAWLNSSEYQPGSELHSRATQFLEAVNWDALLTIASKCRNGMSCSLSSKFSVGHFNMTRRIDFDDGSRWVARLPFPGSDTDREALSRSKTMQIEVASMKFFKSKTSIPVPEVHDYCFTTETEVGAPYILMDYIHGSVASELRDLQDSAPGLFGTPEQDRKFREQLAGVQATVASFRFPKIGGLFYDEAADNFFIGPELQTGKGPWGSSTDYYDDLAHHLLKSANADIRDSPAYTLPAILNFLLRTSSEERNGPFRLANRDFGAHNVLVNEDFDIVGVIDFDGVMAAPLEAVAQYPLHCYIQVEPPGVVDTRPAVVERVAQTIPRLQAYKKMFTKAEEAERWDDAGLKVSERLGSPSASAYQGMVAYQQQQNFVNEKWMKSCSKMLQQKSA